MNCRKVVVDALLPYFRADDRYWLLVDDMGFGAIDNMKREFPARVINCGIMEQATAGIAAGMGLSGCVPIVYCIANLLAFRCVEQIRNDVVLQKVNVKFIGTGANNYFTFLGNSHCCGQDDVKVFNLIGLKVFDPYTTDQPFEEMVKEWILDDRPGYLRV
jgi:transketolase